MTDPNTSSKRVLFGLVFEGTKVPAMGDGFLHELDVFQADGCEHEGNHLMIFTTTKPRRPADVLAAVNAFNATATDEKMSLIAFQDGPEVAVFDRGQCFRSHPISSIIQGATAAGEAWSWSMLADSERKKKRAINELESDLVETAIIPNAPKRKAASRLVEVRIVPCVIGAWREPVVCHSPLTRSALTRCRRRLGPMRTHRHPARRRRGRGLRLPRRGALHPPPSTPPAESRRTPPPRRA
jgi:hypothetical protein